MPEQEEGDQNKANVPLAPHVPCVSMCWINEPRVVMRLGSLESFAEGASTQADSTEARDGWLTVRNMAREIRQEIEESVDRARMLAEKQAGVDAGGEEQETANAGN